MKIKEEVNINERRNTSKLYKFNNNMCMWKRNRTKPEMKVDVCSKCHPFWTGNLRKDTTGGRADKFKKKYGIQ